MTQISVNRYQYGVGQGCFHAQEINVDNATYRLVYDSGGKSEYLEWCIDHFTNQTQGQETNTETIIDAFYLSHFEEDHLNGLKALALKSQIRKIVLPYIDKNDVISLLLQQVFIYDSISPTYVQDLKNISEGNAISGLENIPIIRVQPDDNQPPPLEETPTENNNIGGEQIKDDLPSSSQTIGNKVTKLTSKISFWELVHWAYKPSETSNLSDLVVNKLQSKLGSIPDDIDELCPWLENNRQKIKKAYQEAIKEFNTANPANQIKPQNNHNIVSLCLYSGPLRRSLESYSSNKFLHWWPYPWRFCECHESNGHFKECICGIRLGAWLGTGDAMLGLDDVWSKFQTFFKQRIGRCSTVLIPHHGAGAQSSHNYRGGLVELNRNCVISAGSNNKYKHPHKDVLMDILSRNGKVIIVNENNKLGFIEQVQFS